MKIFKKEKLEQFPVETMPYSDEGAVENETYRKLNQTNRNMLIELEKVTAILNQEEIRYGLVVPPLTTRSHLAK